jgi:ABC-type glycerol-3-phosphate transport system substrate-binding protein
MMRRLIPALILAVTAAGCAAPVKTGAGEITIYSVGLVGSGFDKLVAQWSAKTGNKVNMPIPLANAPLGVVAEAVKTQPADIAIFPTTEMANHAAEFRPGSQKDIGRVLFGVGMRSGEPAPNVATAESLKAALAGKTVLINNPAASISGRMVKAMLDGPGFESVKQDPQPNNTALVLGVRPQDYAVIGVVPEQIMAAPGVRTVGEVPASLGLKIDFSAGVLTKAANPELAASFLAYLVSPEAQGVWKAGGVAVPIPR